MTAQSIQEDEAYKVLKAELDSTLKRANALTEAIKAYKKNMGINDESDTMIDYDKNPPAPFPDYLVSKDLIDKVRYLEVLDPFLKKMWKRPEMEEHIKKIEGDNSKTLNAMQRRFKQYIEEGILFSVRYRKSNKKVFYTTSREWIAQDENGKYYVKPEHAHDEILALPESARKEGEWDGIK